MDYIIFQDGKEVARVHGQLHENLFRVLQTVLQMYSRPDVQLSWTCTPW